VFDHTWDAQTGFRTRDVMCAPALFRDRLVGVVQAMNSKGAPFSEEDLDPLQTAARLVGYALHHASLCDDITSLRLLESQKAEFIRIMVHELKSPVAAAKMTVDVIEHVNPGPEKLHELVGKIGGRMDQLGAMISDLLEMARVKSGSSLGEVRILELAAELGPIVESYRPQAEAKGLSLSFEAPDAPVHARFDSKGLALVASNLVSNAVKYTSEGAVRVRLGRTRRWAVLEVEDTGIGVPEKDIPFMFGEFFRASNAKRSRTAGTGVGLAGAKNLVERFGGEIEFTSAENVGSKFTVRVLACYPDGRGTTRIA
jgi:two-component system phosphate regulon sensor histidine kinase PhoR